MEAQIEQILPLPTCSNLFILPLGRATVTTGRRALIIHRLFTDDPPGNESKTLPVEQDQIAPKGKSRLGVLVLTQIIYYVCLGLVAAVLTTWAAGQVILVATMGAEQVVFYAALVREQSIIAAPSMGSYAQAEVWQWADPWSEKLFVY